MIALSRQNLYSWGKQLGDAFQGGQHTTVLVWPLKDTLKNYHTFSYNNRYDSWSPKRRGKIDSGDPRYLRTGSDFEFQEENQ